MLNVRTIGWKRRCGNATFDHLLRTVNNPVATAADRSQTEADYLGDLIDECEAAGLIDADEANRMRRAPVKEVA